MSLYDRFPDLMDPERVEGYDFEGCWTRQNPDSAYEILDVAMALVATKGNLSKSARMLGRSRRSLWGFVVRDVNLSDLMEDIEASFLDEIEDLHRVTALHDKEARQFFLRTKGRGRGYVTRNEASGPDGGPIEVATLDTANLSSETLRELREALNAPPE